METNGIILTTFVIILIMIISGAAGMWVTGEKGKSTIYGFVIGALIPILGVIGLTMLVKSTDTSIVKEMYDRKIIDLQEYEKMIESKVNNKKQG